MASIPLLKDNQSLASGATCVSASYRSLRFPFPRNGLRSPFRDPILLLAVSLAACSSRSHVTRPTEVAVPAMEQEGQNQHPPQETAALPPDAFLEAFHERACARAVHCEDASSERLQAGFCHPSESRRRAEELTNYDEAAFVAGRIFYHENRATICLAALASCMTRLPCHAVFEGSRLPGETCVDEGCSYSSLCMPPETGGAPVCRRRLGREGDACRSGTCEVGLACVDGLCRTRPRLGEHCTGECAEPYMCWERRCVAAARSGGQPCPAPFRCEAPLICDRSTSRHGVCAEGRGPGEGCNESSPCALGVRCVEGECREVSLPAEPCGERVCPHGFRCDRGSCTPLPVLGDACSETFGCARGACVEGSCTALPTGAPCGPDEPPLGSCAGSCIAGVCS